jgi:DNA-binding beta-propeller fold protein YncE
MDFRVLKIDVDSDLVVDSMAFTQGAYDMVCSPDGKHLWLTASEWEGGTRIYAKDTWQLIKTFVDYVKPVYWEGGITGFSGNEGVFSLDSDFEVLATDTSVTLRDVVMTGPHEVLGRVREPGPNGVQFRYRYYDCKTRQAGDHLDLLDSQGRFAAIRAASADGRFFGFSYVGLGQTNFVVFDSLGNLLIESPFYTAGDIILTEQEILLTDPGDMRNVPTTGFVYVHDLDSYGLVAKISLSGLRDPNEPPYLDVLNADRGAYASSVDRVYLTCSGSGIPGPVISIDMESYAVAKVFYQQTQNYFGNIAIGTAN